MIQHIFAVYDEAAGAYLAPFFLPAVGMATRSFADCVNDPEHGFGRNPKDYTLFLLGNFDDAKASFELREAKQSLGNGLEFLKRQDSHPDLFPDPAKE